MLQWGLLSTARINDKFLAGLTRSATGRALAVAGRDPQRTEAYARQRGIERAHSGYDALLADPDVDAVYVSLPNSLHAEWTARALNAGKHVLCEKPLSRRPGEVARLFALARDRGLVLMEGFMYRHHPQTLRVAELVAEGAIGRLRMIRSSFSFSLRDPGDVRLRAQLDGGCLMDLGCYCVSATRLLGGEPRAVAGRQLIGGDGVDVAFAATLELGDGVLAQFGVGFVLPAGHELEVSGEDGRLLVRDPWHCRAPGIELTRAGATERVPIPAADAYALEADNLAAAVAGAGAPLLGADDALGQARTIDALYRSADTGRWVEPDGG